MKRCTRDHRVRTAGRILFSGLGGRKAPNGMDKISTAGVLRLRATKRCSRDKSVRRSAQDDDFVEVLKKNIPNKLALMGRSPSHRCCYADRTIVAKVRIVTRGADGEFSTTSTPETTIQRAVLNRLRNMPHRDPGLSIEVSDGTSDLQYPVVRSCAQALLLHGPFQQTFRFR